MITLLLERSISNIQGALLERQPCAATFVLKLLFLNIILAMTIGSGITPGHYAVTGAYHCKGGAFLV